MKKAEKLQEIFASFSPHPLAGENFDDFYVDTYEARGNNPIQKIKLNLEFGLNPYFKVLFMGHTGSGKSTELNLLHKELEPDYEIINFFIQEEVDTFDMYYTDFIFAVMSQIIKYLDNHPEINMSYDTIDALYDYWYKEKIIENVAYVEGGAEGSLSGKMSFLKKLSLEGKFIFKTGAHTKKVTREKIEPRLGYLIGLINQLIANVNNELKRLKNKELLIIVEDLDKIAPKSAQGLFVEQRQAVISLKVKFVLTCPIHLVYDREYNMIKNDFDYCQLLNMIKVERMNKEKYPEGIRTIKEIVKKRTELCLFEENVLDFLISKSGGVLRDLFAMIRDAATESILDGRNTISMNDAELVYRNLKSEYSKVIRTDEDVQLLSQIYYEPKPTKTDGTMEDLMSRGLVIEYNGERWCGLHPAVRDFLVEQGKIYVEEE